MNISTNYPLWLVPVCLLLGCGLAWLLYRRSVDRHGWDRRLALLMAVFRASAVSLIAFFLLQPMVKVQVEDIRKPVIVIAHDGSSSLLATSDSAALREAYQQRLEALSDQLSSKFEVRTFTYGQGVEEGLAFGQRQQLTDIDQVFREVYDRFSGPDLGAVIVDGDGIWNRGSDPRFTAQRLGVPVYTIAMGDTTVRADLVLKAVEHNRITYLGNEFPLLVRIEARHLTGKSTRLSVIQAGAEVAGKDISISGDPLFVEVPLLVKATSAGLQRYTVSLRNVEGETTEVNNTRTVLVEVLDDRKKVLLLAAAPHPDLAAIRNALGGLDGFATEIALADGFNGKVEDFDLVVLHQLPSTKGQGKNVLQQIRAKGIPVWYFIGTQTDFPAFEQEAAGLNVAAQRGRITDAQASSDPSFPLFTMDAAQLRSIERFPPLQIPFGEYELGKGASSLFTQRVGVVKTAAPLIAVQQGERRTAVTCGEGFWRWRLADQQMNQGTAHFDGVVRKLVQFLAVKADKQRFRTECAQVFAENEPVIINAELYNASYELVNEPEAKVIITDEGGKDFPFVFSRVGSSYRLEAGQLPPGRYTFTARTTFAGDNLTSSGGFNVQELVAEQLTTTADHGLWRDIAARSSGLFVSADEDGMDRIAAAMGDRKDLAARSYAHSSFSDLIGLKWIFFVLLGLLTAEWGMRRWAGAY